MKCAADDVGSSFRAMGLRRVVVLYYLVCQAAITFGQSTSTIELYGAQFAFLRLAPDLLTTDANLFVDTADWIVIDIATSASSLSTRITDPSGHLYDSNSTPTLGGEYEAYEGAQDGDGLLVLPSGGPGFHYLYRINAPLNGLYEVHVESTALSEETAVIVSVLLYATVRANLFTTTPMVTLGSPAVLTAAVFEGATGVANATVFVRALPPTGTELPLFLRDDGIDADGAPGDGLYSGYFVPSQAGEYRIVADIVGTASNGATFFRMAGTRVLVVNPCAILTGNVSDHGQDDNADGKYDRLIIEAEVNVQAAGTFILQARLETPSGQAMIAHGQAVLSTGPQTIRASIAASALRATGENGSYKIADVQLLCVGDDGAMPSGSIHSDTLYTSPVDINAFQRSPIELTSYWFESPADTDADTDYDRLTIKQGVAVLRPGPYKFEATLRDSCGGTIEVVSGTQDLGSTLLALGFSGAAIGQNGVDGPYSLENLYITGPMDRPARATFRAQHIRETSGYLVSSFDGASAQHDCNNNHISDACDIQQGTSYDCNLNGVPDECEAPPIPQADPSGIAKSRFISFVSGSLSPPRESAIRVGLVYLHHVDPPYSGGASIPFTLFEGQSMYVGPPTQYVESVSSGIPFYASHLQCAPYYQDWSTVGLLHVTGEAIVPSSTYLVEIVSSDCAGNEANCCLKSAPLEIQTTRWGDVETPYRPPDTSPQPDTSDISALINKFKSALGAPIKARGLLYGQNARGDIDVTSDLGFTHISLCIDAFKGLPYPYKPGKCTGGLRACVTDSDCVGSNCVGGTNDGTACNPGACVGGGVCTPNTAPCTLCP